MKEAKLALLNDHYKETFAIIQEHLRLRDRLFAYSLIIISVMLFQMHSPSGSSEALSELITNKLELDAPVDISFLTSLLWFALLSVVVRYYQTVVYIERQYTYIHRIEDQLSPEYEGRAFTREGKSYLKNYPLFSSWAWILYTIVFPALLAVIVVVKIIGEIRHMDGAIVSLSINMLIALSIVLSSVFYVLLVHFKR